MQLDSRCIGQLVAELEQLINARVDRIGQPRHDELHIGFRGTGNTQRLCISLRADLPRAHLSSLRLDNPRQAPTLCMALRRHLEGARLIAASCPRWERYFTLTFAARNRLGDLVLLDLVVELIPRASNLTLVDKAAGAVLASWRHRPGQQYIAPALQEGILPPDLEVAHLVGGEEGPLWRTLMGKLRGFGPLLAKEAVHRTELPLLVSTDQARSKISQVAQSVRDVAASPLAPTLYYDEAGQVRFWHVIELHHLPPLRAEAMPSAQQAAETFYRLYLAQQTMNNRKVRMRQVINTSIKRAARKLANQTADLQRAEPAEDYKLWGELIYAQAPTALPGAREVQVVNYYTSDEDMLTIPLDPSLSLRDNARTFFTKYSKALRTREKAKRALDKSRAQFDYLESLLESLQAAQDPHEIDEIWEEMQSEGMIRDKTAAVTSRRERPSSFSGLVFTSPEQHQILLGKNHRQNEQLVRMARPQDVWLHARGVPGAHALVRSPSDAPSDWPAGETLLMAAQLAAYYSKAAQASLVDVDWTWAKHVRKIKQGKPGMVIYDGEQTLRVAPKTYVPNQPPD